MVKEKSGRARLVLLLWLLVAIFYFYLASDYIQIVMRDDAFEDYLEFSVQLVGSQGRPNTDLKELVMAKARELEIPLDPDRVDIQGRRQTLVLRVGYDVDVQIPLIANAGYSKEFSHEIRFSDPRG